jgi:hypothetical protein
MSGIAVISPVSGTASAGEARKPIAVFLLDDHEVVRRGVRDLLAAPRTSAAAPSPPPATAPGTPAGSS